MSTQVAGSGENHRTPPAAASSEATADSELTEGVLLQLDGVDVRYEDATEWVLRAVDLTVRTGESVLFLGPSGCGKSTLAMVCANLLPGAVEGSVTGQVRRSPALCEPGSVGYVFQDADAQFCMLTTADEVAFGLENQGVARAEMAPKIREALATAGLAVSPTAAHATFSGGMKQKLAIACALAMDSQLLVLDEPTANLDPQSTRQVFEQITQLHKAGRTLIVIEHKFEPLIEQMDHVVLFTRDGRIHRSGPAAQVIAQEWGWLVQEGVARPEARWERVSRPADVTVPGLTAPAVSLHGADLAYGKTSVWSDVSLDLPPAQITAVVGPNGSGKSSLLQVLAGLQKPTKGIVELLGRPLATWKRAARASTVSFCFQNPEYQFIYERVADEMANRVIDGELPPKAQALLDELGLTDAAEQSPFALSQGQKRRLSVAVMLQDEHDVYLLDEPTFGQDAKTETVIMNKLCALRDAGKAIAITTHDMSLVARYADQVVVLADGGLSFVGTPQQLFASPGVMRQAHLLDDLAQDREADTWTEATDPAPREAVGAPTAANSDLLEAGAGDVATGTTALRPPSVGRGLGPRLNPPLLLIAIVSAAFVAIFAERLPQALAVFGWPILLMITLFRMSPWRVFKRLSVFLVFYILYTWSYVAFTRVPPGTPVVHVLWMHPSLSGLHTGLVLAFRMLAAVALGILFISNCDLTDLIVGWSSNFRVPPKFTYGMLAGMHFLPMFRTEWVKLRQARQLRGKDASYALVRVVTYALPILSQAIRLSERVAIAMEARGLIGLAATSAPSRSYFRNIRLRALDWGFASFLVLSMCGLLIVFR